MVGTIRCLEGHAVGERHGQAVLAAGESILADERQAVVRPEPTGYQPDGVLVGEPVTPVEQQHDVVVVTIDRDTQQVDRVVPTVDRHGGEPLVVGDLMLEARRADEQRTRPLVLVAQRLDAVVEHRSRRTRVDEHEDGRRRAVCRDLGGGGDRG